MRTLPAASITASHDDSAHAPLALGGAVPPLAFATAGGAAAAAEAAADGGAADGGGAAGALAGAAGSAAAASDDAIFARAKGKSGRVHRCEAGGAHKAQCVTFALRACVRVFETQ